MVAVESHEEDAGPGEYKFMSVVNVWHDDQTGGGTSIALHVAPRGIAKEDRQLGTVTRVAYHALEIANSVRSENNFVALHFLPEECAVDVTMLPVGDEGGRAVLDANLKSGAAGFQAILLSVSEWCTQASAPRMDSVRVLYNDPSDFGSPGKIGIVHELNASVVAGEVEEFMRATTGREN